MEKCVHCGIDVLTFAVVDVCAHPSTPTAKRRCCYLPPAGGPPPTMEHCPVGGPVSPSRIRRRDSGVRVPESSRVRCGDTGRLTEMVREGLMGVASWRDTYDLVVVGEEGEE